MTRLIFATNNLHKVQEVQSAAGNHFGIITLEQAGIIIDIPEPHNTLEANATEKSTTIYKLTGHSCFSEDTGLEVEALQGAPGVQSARYAGAGRADKDNIRKLLHNLTGIVHRKARFRTVVSLIVEGRETVFEGICEGSIELEPQGDHGFGYDPVFRPSGSAITFAEMTIEEKGMYSHRKKAIDKLVAFLQHHNSPFYNSKSK